MRGPIWQWQREGATFKSLSEQRYCSAGARQAVKLTCGRYKPAVVCVMAQLWIVVTYKLVQRFMLRSVAADNGHNNLSNTNWTFYSWPCYHLALNPHSSMIGLQKFARRSPTNRRTIGVYRLVQEQMKPVLSSIGLSTFSRAPTIGRMPTFSRVFPCFALPLVHCVIYACYDWEEDRGCFPLCQTDRSEISGNFREKWNDIFRLNRANQ